MKKALFLLSLVMFCSTQVFGWGQKGHDIAAYIAEQHLTPTEDGCWMLSADVANYAGVARFVVGLMDDITIIDTPELEQYISAYVDRHWRG